MLQEERLRQQHLIEQLEMLSQLTTPIGTPRRIEAAFLAEKPSDHALHPRPGDDEVPDGPQSVAATDASACHSHTTAYSSLRSSCESSSLSLSHSSFPGTDGFGMQNDIQSEPTDLIDGHANLEDIVEESMSILDEAEMEDRMNRSVREQTVLARL